MLLEIQIIIDIQKELEFFFSGLNWTYIFIYVITLFGIKSKQEFIWYNDFFNKRKSIKPFKVWIAGVILMFIFGLFSYLETSELKASYISQMLRSFVVVTVFNSFFIEKVKKIEDSLDGDVDK